MNRSKRTNAARTPRHSPEPGNACVRRQRPSRIACSARATNGEARRRRCRRCSPRGQNASRRARQARPRSSTDGPRASGSKESGLEPPSRALIARIELEPNSRLPKLLVHFHPSTTNPVRLLLRAAPRPPTSVVISSPPPPSPQKSKVMSSPASSGNPFSAANPSRSSTTLASCAKLVSNAVLRGPSSTK